MNLLRELDDDDRVMTGAIMTSFPFAHRFFERAVLPALRDKGLGDQVAVLLDTDQYRSTLPGDTSTSSGHESPQHVGQRYHLAPVAAGPRQTFHPKIHLLTGDRRIQAAVTSANLTHSGLTDNREIATRFELKATDDEGEEDSADDPEALLTRGEKAALFGEIREFFDELLSSPHGRSVDGITAETIRETLAAGEWVDNIATPAPEDRRTKFIHSLDGSILTQVRSVIRARDETIQRADIAVPFYGTSLGVPRVFTDDGIETQLWLQNSRTQIPKDDLSDWLEEPTAAAVSYEASRYVHGKVVLIQTDEGVYCLNGSQNGSRSALLASAGESGNIEASILRRSDTIDYFDYLFDSPPFSNAEPVDLATFEASQSTLFASHGEDHEVGMDGSLSLNGISYRRRGSYDGGQLQLTGSVSPALKERLVQHGAELIVSSGDGTASPRSVKLRPHEFEWDATESLVEFTLTRDLFGKDAEQPFIRTATAHLECDGQQSQTRWIQTRSPQAGQPIAADVEDAGATAVPQRLLDLYLGESEQQAIAVESLNGLLSALSQQDDKLTRESTDGATEQDGPRGGLVVRPWSQSGSEDPDDLVESFFEGWVSDIREFERTTRLKHYQFEEVETRLKAINTATLQLLLLDEAWGDLSISRQPALNAIKDVYSEDGPQEASSYIASYFEYLGLLARKHDDEAEVIYAGLEEEILPQILLGTIIAETHVADSPKSFANQQGWAFEDLICQCYPLGAPEAVDFKNEQIETLVRTIEEATEGLRARIEESRSLRRVADRRYLRTDHLRHTVVEILARSLLYAGEDAVKRFRADAKTDSRVEQVFEKYVEYLPKKRQRQADEWL